MTRRLILSLLAVLVAAVLCASLDSRSVSYSSQDCDYGRVPCESD